jgi:hypothetical protein
MQATLMHGAHDVRVETVPDARAGPRFRPRRQHRRLDGYRAMNDRDQGSVNLLQILSFSHDLRIVIGAFFLKSKVRTIKKDRSGMAIA